jgi:hypothetical protein
MSVAAFEMVGRMPGTKIAFYLRMAGPYAVATSPELGVSVLAPSIAELRARVTETLMGHFGEIPPFALLVGNPTHP